MKAFAVLFALFAAAQCQYITPSVYSHDLSYPYLTGLNSHIVSPLAYSSAYNTAYHYNNIAPIAYSAPLAYTAPAVVPAIKSGYVAATRGSLHTAPLPEGPFAASHHLNLAPAPGTL